MSVKIMFNNSDACDNCGRKHMEKEWWIAVYDSRYGPLKFCSEACKRAWFRDPDKRRKAELSMGF